MLENNNHKNTICAFAGQQLVSYLYGETNADEKILFEAHLESCQVCAEEFAGFAAVSSSIVNWRNEEFLALETPAIKIPYESSKGFYNSSRNTKASHSSWLAELRRQFSFSPTLRGASAAALALAIICVGLIFFTVKPAGKLEVAEKAVNKTDVENVSPTQTAAIDKNVDNDSKLPNLAAKAEISKLTPEVKLPRKHLAAKVTIDTRNYAKNTNQDTIAHTIKLSKAYDKNSTYAQTVKLPRLNNIEEVEDKSLRLAELLDDDSGAK